MYRISETFKSNTVELLRILNESSEIGWLLSNACSFDSSFRSIVTIRLETTNHFLLLIHPKFITMIVRPNVHFIKIVTPVVVFKNFISSL